MGGAMSAIQYGPEDVSFISHRPMSATNYSPNDTFVEKNISLDAHRAEEIRKVDWRQLIGKNDDELEEEQRDTTR